MKIKAMQDSRAILRGDRTSMMGRYRGVFRVVLGFVGTLTDWSIVSSSRMTGSVVWVRDYRWKGDCIVWEQRAGGGKTSGRVASIHDIAAVIVKERERESLAAQQTGGQRCWKP